MKSLSLFFAVVLIKATNLVTSFQSPQNPSTEHTSYISQRDSVAKILTARNLKVEHDFTKFSDSLYQVVVMKKERINKLNKAYLTFKDTL